MNDEEFQAAVLDRLTKIETSLKGVNPIRCQERVRTHIKGLWGALCAMAAALSWLIFGK